MSDCPCGSRRTCEACCGPIIAGAPAATAEALMRARYTAFLQGELDFLEATLAPEMLDRFDRAEVAASAREASGLGFELRRAVAGGEADDAGEVEYIARFTMNGQPYVHHERASFRREDGRWLYAKGEVNPTTGPRQVEKVGRNDPCPCGSGRKFKKCCGG